LYVTGKLHGQIYCYTAIKGEEQNKLLLKAPLKKRN
jgi:hypothetical protein